MHVKNLCLKFNFFSFQCSVLFSAIYIHIYLFSSCVECFDTVWKCLELFYVVIAEFRRVRSHVLNHVAVMKHTRQLLVIKVG